MADNSGGLVVETFKLTKIYQNCQIALNDVTLRIEPGCVLGLLGPNGAGKTTTISILTTTLAPTSGVVRVGNHDVSREASHIRREVGIIFQRPSLDLNLTAD